MTLQEFLKSNKISSRVFAEACGINHNTFKMYVYKGRTPPLTNAYKIILQSGYHVTLEDLVGHISWTPKPKLKTMGKDIINGAKLKKHERRKFFSDLDNI